VQNFEDDELGERWPVRPLALVANLSWIDIKPDFSEGVTCVKQCGIDVSGVEYII
jgi:hypothetical protein